MALTDHCDLFATFHESGFDRIVFHAMRQRPSMFNFATQYVADRPAMACQVIDSHPVVGLRDNPLFTIVDPLPIPGTKYGVNFCAQISDLQIDFHPGNRIGLPPELNPPLPAQRFAVELKVCGGVGCPPKDVIDSLIPPPPEPPPKARPGSRLLTAPVRRSSEAPSRSQVWGGTRDLTELVVPLPCKKLTCFCVKAIAVGGARIATYYTDRPFLEFYLDGLEVVDVQPAGLENSIECFIISTLRLSVLPRLSILLDSFSFEIGEGLAHIRVKPTPISPDVPNNPSIEDDRVSAFVDVEVS